MLNFLKENLADALTGAWVLMIWGRESRGTTSLLGPAQCHTEAWGFRSLTLGCWTLQHPPEIPELVLTTAAPQAGQPVSSPQPSHREL